MVRQNEKQAKLEEIYVITDWGRDMSNTDKVPSAFSYTPATADEEQWGASMSTDATVMVHTKLELDVQDNKSDELDIILHNLDGMGNLDFAFIKDSKGKPSFSSKRPDDIIKDYLEKIFERVMRFLEQDLHIEESDRNRMPVDIVFTVPVAGALCLLGVGYPANTIRIGRIARRMQHTAELHKPDSIKKRSRSYKI